MEQLERHHQEDNNAHLIFKMPPSITHLGGWLYGAVIVAKDMKAGVAGSYLTVNVSGQISNVGKGPAQNIAVDIITKTMSKRFLKSPTLPLLTEGAQIPIDSIFIFKCDKREVQPTLSDLDGSVLTITYENKYKAVGAIRLRVIAGEDNSMEYSHPEMLEPMPSDPPQYITLAERRERETMTLKQQQIAALPLPSTADQ